MYAFMNGRVISALRSGRKLNSQHQPQETLPHAVRRRHEGVGRQQHGENQREGDEGQPLVGHEHDRTDEHQREHRADLGHVPGKGDQYENDQGCAEHDEILDSRMRKL